MNRKPLGNPVRASLDRNCLLCTRWVTCRDPSKEGLYACSKFSKEHDFNILDLFEKEEEDEARAHIKTDSGLLLPVSSLSKGALVNRSVYNSSIQVTDMDKEEDDDPTKSFTSIINKVLNSGVPVPPDLRIDDRDIPRPKNIVDWITDEQYVGGDDPFGKQIQIMAHYMAEWCPRCSDEDYFENVPVKDRIGQIRDHVVFLENGVCPNCRKNKVKLIDRYDLKDPMEMIGIVGQRGSKTISGTMISSYNLMRWLMTPNLPATYKIKASTILTCTYTATTFNQVKENFWLPYDSLISGSPWFKNYHKFLEQTGYKYGEELYKRSETVLAYKHKNIFASPASPSMRALRGRTRIESLIDEGGWMKTGKTKGGGDFEMMNGTEVYASLKNSLRTMTSAYMRRLEAGYFNLPKPLMTLISSPSARNDLIMTKFREAQGDRKTYYFKYATWEFNPTLLRKDFDDDFRRRPIEAARDFGCEPPMAMNAWIPDEELVESSFSGGKNLVSTITRRFRTKSNRLTTSATLKAKYTLREEHGGVMGIDVGHNNNSFAIAIAYPTSIPDVDDEDEEEVFVGVSIPILIEIIPKKEYPISQTKVYNDIIKPLCEMFNVAVVVSDSWQNKKIVQDLDEALGIDHYEFKLKLEDFDDYKQCMYDEMITHPKLDMPMDAIVNMTLDNYPDCFAKTPAAHLAFQMLTVQNSGNAIIKGEDGTTDDLLRACVVAHCALQDEEVLEASLAFTMSAPKTPAFAAMAAGAGGKASNLNVNGFGVMISTSNRGSFSGGSASLGTKIARR